MKGGVVRGRARACSGPAASARRRAVLAKARMVFLALALPNQGEDGGLATTRMECCE